jgi:hypothetical protein
VLLANVLSGTALDRIGGSSGKPAAGACLINTEPAINLSQRVACSIGIKIDESFEDRHASFAGGSSQAVQSDRERPSTEVRRLRWQFGHIPRTRRTLTRPSGTIDSLNPVRLLVMARRFYCNAVLCGRRIFTERFGGGLLAPWARRTARLDHIVHHLGLALGRPAASFAQRPREKSPSSSS